MICASMLRRPTSLLGVYGRLGVEDSMRPVPVAAVEPDMVAYDGWR
jgi:hypothetical protein